MRIRNLVLGLAVTGFSFFGYGEDSSNEKLKGKDAIHVAAKEDIKRLHRSVQVGVKAYVNEYLRLKNIYGSRIKSWEKTKDKGANRTDNYWDLVELIFSDLLPTDYPHYRIVRNCGSAMDLFHVHLSKEELKEAREVFEVWRTCILVAYNSSPPQVVREFINMYSHLVGRVALSKKSTEGS